MGLGVEVKVIFTNAEYNRLLRATVESGKKLPRNYVRNATNEAVDKFLSTEAVDPKVVVQKLVSVVPKVGKLDLDLSHFKSDAGPSATPSVGSS